MGREQRSRRPAILRLPSRLGGRHTQICGQPLSTNNHSFEHSPPLWLTLENAIAAGNFQPCQSQTNWHAHANVSNNQFVPIPIISHWHWLFYPISPSIGQLPPPSVRPKLLRPFLHHGLPNNDGWLVDSNFQPATALGKEHIPAAFANKGR